MRITCSAVVSWLTVMALHVPLLAQEVLTPF